jgi:hypothetical protein
MIKMIAYVSVVFLLGVANAKSSGTKFRVRPVERRAQYNKNDFVLTHSDDGKSKSLPRFLVDIFETKGQIDVVALTILRMAMNKFLLAEFNAIYEPQSNQLESVGTEIFETSIIPPGKNGRMLEANKQGTELEMMVTLTFDNEPSPGYFELQEKLIEVMSNLTYFVTNLTSFGNEDLEDVTEAYRRELPTESPTQSPVDNTDASNGLENGVKQENQNRIASNVVAPTLVAATLIALIVYLVFRRKGRADAETPKSDLVYADAENDLFSMDRSLESSQSPPEVHSPPGDSVELFSMSADSSTVQGDSVFSGIDYSPTNTNKSTAKSLKSSLTNASASTVPVSNLHERSKLQANPKSMSMGAQNSLSAFSEEGYGLYDDEDDYSDIMSPKMADAPSLIKSDVSDDSPERLGATETGAPRPSRTDESSSTLEGTVIEQPTSILGQCFGGTADTSEPATSNHVLEDLAVLAWTRGTSPRDPTPTAMTDSAGAVKSRDPTPRVGETTTVSYNPFNCNPILGTDPAPKSDTPKSEASPTAYSARVTRKPAGDNPYAVNSTMKTPLKRNSVGLASTIAGSRTATVASPRSDGEEAPGTAASMSAKATSTVGGARRNTLSTCPPAVSSTMKTPLKRNSALATETPGSRTATVSSQWSATSQRSPAREDGKESPGTVASMSARAMGIIGDVFGNEANRERASTMDGGNKPDTPKSTSAPGSPIGAEDYGDNNNRLHTSGGEFNTSPQVSDHKSYSCLPFGRIVDRAPPPGDGAKKEDPPEGAYPYAGGRRHAGNNAGIDGSAMYQTNAMHPLDWSYRSADLQSVGDSTISEGDGTAMPRQFIFAVQKDARATLSPHGGDRSEASARTGATTKDTNGSSHASASRQLINDLVWLEKKIADVRQTSSSALGSSDLPPAIDTVDSLSYVSNDNDAFVSTSSHDDSEDYSNKNESVMSSIVCRDCYAPPGKLHIVIHSTKDGPAVHTVKEGSSLEGHIFPGDLIISVDDVDTRSYTAEQVMKMMASKSERERKITVLHFDEED